MNECTPQQSVLRFTVLPFGDNTVAVNPQDPQVAFIRGVSHGSRIE
jgi:hypothetical protein